MTRPSPPKTWIKFAWYALSGLTFVGVVASVVAMWTKLHQEPDVHNNIMSTVEYPPCSPGIVGARRRMRLLDAIDVNRGSLFSDETSLAENIAVKTVYNTSFLHTLPAPDSCVEATLVSVPIGPISDYGEKVLRCTITKWRNVMEDGVLMEVRAADLQSRRSYYTRTRISPYACRSRLWLEKRCSVPYTGLSFQGFGLFMNISSPITQTIRLEQFSKEICARGEGALAYVLIATSVFLVTIVLGWGFWRRERRKQMNIGLQSLDLKEVMNES